MLEPLAASFGIELTPAPAPPSEQLETALAVLARERPQMLMMHPAPPIGLHSARIARFAIRHRIAALANTDDDAPRGLVAVGRAGPRLADQGRGVGTGTGNDV